MENEKLLDFWANKKPKFRNERIRDYARKNRLSELQLSKLIAKVEQLPTFELIETREPCNTCIFDFTGCGFELIEKSKNGFCPKQSRVTFKIN